jgi:hypothetical protein
MIREASVRHTSIQLSFPSRPSSPIKHQPQHSCFLTILNLKVKAKRDPRLPTSEISASSEDRVLTMSSLWRRHAWDLLPLLVFTLVASTSSAFSSQPLASARYDQRKHAVCSPNRLLGRNSHECRRNRRIHAALTGSLSGGGEPRSVVSRLKSLALKNLLIVGMVGAVLLARVYPEVRQQTLLAFKKAIAAPCSHFQTSSERMEAC